MSSERTYDIVVWGATGFTGSLTAEYLLRRYGVDGSFRWALGGRSQEKLESVRSAIGREVGVDASALPLVLGDAADAASMARLAESTRVVCTTVGPYAIHGSELVGACVRAATHVCDLTGELHWMRRMIDQYEDDARASGARIVHTCGFDCIPADLGVAFVQREMLARHGTTSSEVKLRVAGFSGGASGGTLASMLNMMEEAAEDPEVMRVMSQPYALNPKDQRSGPPAADQRGPVYDRDFGQWTAPFVMAGIDTRVVRRTNALLDYPYGRDFHYEEATLAGAGPAGFAKAAGLAAATAGGMAAMAIGPVRRRVANRLPAPGEGPTREQQERGYWDLRLHARHPDDASLDLRARVTGDRDPGYGSTAKMLGESAVCLAQDELACPGGFLTPAAAMGETLQRRLEAHAGVSFEIDPAGKGNA